jgi:hypothetical protein
MELSELIENEIENILPGFIKYVLSERNVGIE